jgi:hypothetical protein
MFRSMDAGANWQSLAIGLQTERENHQALLAIGDTLFLKSYTMTGERRTYQLIDNEWVAAPIAGPAGVDVTTFFANGSTLYAGSNEQSVWTRAFTPQASVYNVTPIDLNLRTFPNPFKGVSNVSFDLPSSSYVRAGLYDLTGRSVLDLQAGVLSQGAHTLLIAGAQLPEGSYICRIATKNGVAQTQVVLLR